MALLAQSIVKIVNGGFRTMPLPNGATKSLSAPACLFTGHFPVPLSNRFQVARHFYHEVLFSSQSLDSFYSGGSYYFEKPFVKSHEAHLSPRDAEILDKTGDIILKLPTEEVSTFFTIEANQGIDYVDRLSDSRMEKGEIKLMTLLALSNLNPPAPSQKTKVLEAIHASRSQIVSESGCLDNNLMMSLPAIAQKLRDPDDFINALFIERSFYSCLTEIGPVAEWEFYCLDYENRLGGGTYQKPILTKTVFSLYERLFPNNFQLADFVKKFAQMIRDNPDLTQNITTEAQLCAYISELAGVSYFRNSPAKNIKGVIVDADGVLWQGIFGEDGFDGIIITEEHRVFQQALRDLQNLGYVLAICSKNNPGDVEEVLEKHPRMVLRSNDFVTIKSNWQDKAVNIDAISQELNLGLDNFVFLDDSPHERDMVANRHPEILIPEMPSSPGPLDFKKKIEDLGLFAKREITDEDRRRTDYYLAGKQRQQLLAVAASPEEGYRLLAMKLLFREGDANQPHIARIAQLSQRTNQFNLTGRRYSEESIAFFLKSLDYRVLTMELFDKFGPSGIVGLMVIRADTRDGEKLDPVIEEFCLSCRAIGLATEKAFMAYALNEAKKAGISCLFGEVRPTKKNLYFQGIYETFGFRRDHIVKDRRLWVIVSGAAEKQVEFDDSTVAAINLLDDQRFQTELHNVEGETVTEGNVTHVNYHRVRKLIISDASDELVDKLLGNDDIPDKDKDTIREVVRQSRSLPSELAVPDWFTCYDMSNLQKLASDCGRREEDEERLKAQGAFIVSVERTGFEADPDDYHWTGRGTVFYEIKYILPSKFSKDNLAACSPAGLVPPELIQFVREHPPRIDRIKCDELPNYNRGDPIVLNLDYLGIWGREAGETEAIYEYEVVYYSRADLKNLSTKWSQKLLWQAYQQTLCR